MPFLMIGPDSRSGGMGDAGVALPPDANALHWNPSKLAFAENEGEFRISVSPWLRNLVPDMSLAYLAGYKKLNKRSALGGSLRYFNLGSITFTDINGGVIRDFKPAEFAVDVSFAQQFSEQLAGGISLRYINGNLTGGLNVSGANTKAGQAVAADISFFYRNDRMLIAKRTPPSPLDWTSPTSATRCPTAKPPARTSCRSTCAWAPRSPWTSTPTTRSPSTRTSTSCWCPLRLCTRPSRMMTAWRYPWWTMTGTMWCSAVRTRTGASPRAFSVPSAMHRVMYTTTAKVCSTWNPVASSRRNCVRSISVVVWNTGMPSSSRSARATSGKRPRKATASISPWASA
ncbi:MAG: PorV/PorQ family protein [Flavobacteriales bacterium]|nr:PorV/PorQ family protein [Flavobacteriales bacterium]